MSLGTCGLALLAAFLSAAAYGQDAQQIVEQAVRTELAADAADHTHWLYYETELKPDHTAKQWVAETAAGNLVRVMEDNGRTLSEQEQRSSMDSFISNSTAQVRERKAGKGDDQQATEMLQLLPQAFLWTKTGTSGSDCTLHFKPNPQFRPPDYEARVFAAMEGDMTVDDAQHRIVSLKGRMIHDVRFLGGLLGELEAGGTFDVERREVGKDLWQITETHIHIHGHALLFKTISDQEDESKSKLKQLPANTTLQEAEKDLLEQGR